jgi:ATP-dependent Clp protease ATP-binding subunit ClpB
VSDFEGAHEDSSQIRLDPALRSPLAQRFEDELHARVVGQDRAVRELSSLYEVALAGINAPNRPIGTMLLLGPTGCGKTRVAEAAAEVLFGTGSALIKIDCAEYQHPHEIAKLIGSPPGYVGHSDTPALFTQELLDRRDWTGLRLTVLLLDEIEKASPALWQLLLGVLDRASLTLGDNRRIDFSRTIVIMSSNLGSEEIASMLTGGVGFAAGHEQEGTIDRFDERVSRAAIEAARRHFSPEFMNRIDKVVVFRPLGEAQLRQVLELELQSVQTRILRDTGAGFELRCSDEARQLLLKEGTDRRYGARHLRRAIDRLLVTPLARLITSGQVHGSDIVDVGVDAGGTELAFHKTSGVGRKPFALDRDARATATSPVATSPQAVAAAMTIATTIAVTAAVGLAAGLSASALSARPRR